MQTLREPGSRQGVTQPEGVKAGPRPRNRIAALPVRHLLHARYVTCAEKQSVGLPELEGSESWAWRRKSQHAQLGRGETRGLAEGILHRAVVASWMPSVGRGAEGAEQLSQEAVSLPSASHEKVGEAALAPELGPAASNLLLDCL